MNNFHYVAVLLDQLYGVEMEDDDLEELGLIAWELIGNRRTKLYEYSACPDSNNSIQLPCNASDIEAVTENFEDWNRVTNTTENGDWKSAYIENSIELEKMHTNPYYISGRLTDYELVGDTLYFKQTYGPLRILYKGIIADDDGLPELTDKEALAIATYLAYTQKYKEGLKTNNTVIINLATNLENKWLKQCDQARVSRLSQNDMNQILKIKSSWDRPNYGFSYKPLR